MIADNKLAQHAEWDSAVLGETFRVLSKLDLKFDLEITGFDPPEIDYLVEGLRPFEEADPCDDVPETNISDPPVSRTGDLWYLGAHRLLCADATKPESFSVLMDGKKAQVGLNDPPYNVHNVGHTGGSGRIKHEDFLMASGEMSEAQFTGFLTTVFRNLAANSANGSIHFIFMDWRHLNEALTAGKLNYTQLLNICVWNKTNGGMGSLYRSKHELVLVYKSGQRRHINNVELGRHGRNRTNVWDYAGVNTMKEGRLEELSMHPTVKPVALIADALLDCSKRGGIVLDSFAGSGTTTIAAEKTGRRAFTMELDPKYVDVAIRRWQEFTGEAAIHHDTGLKFSKLRNTRSGDTERKNGRSTSNQRKPKNG